MKIYGFRAVGGRSISFPGETERELAASVPTDARAADIRARTFKRGDETYLAVSLDIDSASQMAADVSKGHVGLADAEDGTPRLVDRRHFSAPAMWTQFQSVRCFDPEVEQLRARALVALCKPPEGYVEPIENRAAGDEVTWIEVSGDIDAAMASKLVAKIAATGGNTICLDIDSEGGNVEAGRRIFNALAERQEHVITRVVDKACSMAAIIFLAGDSREMGPDARLMFHAPHVTSVETLTVAGLKQEIEALETERRALAQMIESRTDLDIDTGLAMLGDTQDTNLTAREAVDIGIATRIATEIVPAKAVAMRARFRAINGAFRSVRPTNQPPVMRFGKFYRAGDIVSHLGKRYRAKAQGWSHRSRPPGTNKRDWEAL